MKTGIVVEGGGMRGIYGAGVLDVLLENDIKALSACLPGQYTDAALSQDRRDVPSGIT